MSANAMPVESPQVPKKQYNKIEPKQLNRWAVLANQVSVFLLWIYLNTCFKRYKVEGRENIPADGNLSYIVACNHVSSLDPPIISVALRYHPIAYMAKQELFVNRFAAAYYSFLCTFSVNREKLELSTIKSAFNVLKAPGWILGIFPEGTRNDAGEIMEAKRGLAYIAQTAKVGVLPMGICRKGKDRKEICAKIGEFMPYEPDMPLDELTHNVQSRIAELVTAASQF